MGIVCGTFCCGADQQPGNSVSDAPAKSGYGVEMAQIYKGITHYGLLFPFTWGYTQDNQVLSLLPFAEIYYAIAGVSGTTIIIQGWLIFVVNAALTGLLVRTATRSWRWAALAWLLALMASPIAVGQPAILAYPVTHNSVWAFGLLGAIGMVRYLADRPRWALPIVSLCIIVGTVSDPWFDAAFTVPAFILAWLSGRLFGTDRMLRRTLLKGIVYSYILGRVAYFCGELIGMLPSRGGFSLATFLQMAGHVWILAKTVALYFQLYPAPQSPWLWIVWIVSVVSIGMVILLGLKPAYRKNDVTKVMLSFFALSFLAIASAFIMTTYAVGLGSSRFIVNIFYLGIAVIVVASASLWKSQKGIKRVVVVMAISGYLLLGVVGVVQTGWRLTADWGATAKLAEFLAAHHLRNGYGEYWNTGNAWSLDILTRENIIVHALSPNMGFLWPRDAAQSSFWNKPSHSFEPTFFISDASDPGYNKATIKTFGIPETILHFENDSIYLYDHDLSGDLVLAMRNGWARWNSMNNARNRAAINRACSFLHVDSRWAQNSYSWLMSHGLAK